MLRTKFVAAVSAIAILAGTSGVTLAADMGQKQSQVFKSGQGAAAGQGQQGVVKGVTASGAGATGGLTAGAIAAGVAVAAAAAVAVAASSSDDTPTAVTSTTTTTATTTSQ